MESSSLTKRKSKRYSFCSLSQKYSCFIIFFFFDNKFREFELKLRVGYKSKRLKISSFFLSNLVFKITISSRKTKISVNFNRFLSKSLIQMAKRIKVLEKDCHEWRVKYEKCNRALLDMATDKQAQDQYVGKASRQLSQLQKLCRTLQVRSLAGFNNKTMPTLFFSPHAI